MGLAGQKHFGQSAQLNSAHASKIQEAAGCWLELETKAIRRFAKVSIVSYSHPSLMIIASVLISRPLTVGSMSV